ncbi:MAG: hypothetical protein ACI4GC_03020 [Acutalibacteraceae bacterium]
MKAKKIIACLLVAITLFCFSNCGNSGTVSTQEITASEDAASEASLLTTTTQLTTEATTLPDDEKVTISFSNEDALNKSYDLVYNKLKQLGFTNIELSQSEMDYQNQEEFNGAVTSVSVGGKSEFSKDESFEKDIEIVISYVKDYRIKISKESEFFEGYDYEKVVSVFKNAGFTDIDAVSVETEYDESYNDGSVIRVEVDGDEYYDAGEVYFADTPIVIYYRDMQAKPVETTAYTTTRATTEATTERAYSQSSDSVWIPQSGSKYHSSSSCSGMKNPSKVSKSQAISWGYEPCKKCYG